MPRHWEPVEARGELARTCGSHTVPSHLASVATRLRYGILPPHQTGNNPPADLLTPPQRQSFPALAEWYSVQLVAPV